MRRVAWINLGLLGIAIAGAVVSVQRATEVADLRAQYTKLSGEFGVLKIDDPTKISFIQLKTQDPMHFRWRFYIPPTTRAKFARFSGSNSFSTFNSPSEFLGEVKFRMEDGRLMNYGKFHGGSSLNTIGTPKSGQYVVDNWHGLQIDVAGSDGPIQLEHDEVIELIRISVPLDQFKEAEQKLPRHSFPQGNSIFQIRFGEQDAFDRE